MAKTVLVPVKFVDQSNSAAKAAEGLSEAIKGIKLPESIKSDADNLIKRLVDFQSRTKGLGGKEVSPGQKISIEAESKQLQKETENLIKEIEGQLRSLDMPDEIKTQLEGMEKQLKSKESVIKNKTKELFDLSRVGKQDVEGTGFTSIRYIDKLIPKIEEYRNRVKELATIQATTGFSKEQEKEYQLLLSRASAIDNLEQKIKKQVEASKLVQDALDKEQKEADELTNSIHQLEMAYGDSNPEIQKAIENLRKAKKGTKEWDDAAEQLRIELKAQKADMEGSNKSIKTFTDNLKDSVKNLFGYAAVFSLLKRTLRDSIRVITQLDKSFTEIAMVTTYSTKEVWKMKDAFIGLANTTGLTITEISKLSVEFFRQGRSMSETMKLVEAAGIAAKLAGISTSESVRFLTSAINGYRLAADQAMVVSDKFAALAASSATDYEELATALSKVASQAYAAGVNMDNMMGFIAKALETTREAPENIGTAFKTIFARMQEIKDYGKTLEDGMDVNRVDAALRTIGVALNDQNNELRNLDEVLIDVGNKWPLLTKNQKAYIATALAGTRQQTRLLAVFEDFDRTMELTKVSADSLGASYAQQAKYYESIEYAVTNLTNTWQDFISSLISSDIVKLLTNILTMALGLINTLTGNWIGQTILLITALTFAFHALAGAIAEANLSGKGWYKGLGKGLDFLQDTIKSVFGLTFGLQAEAQASKIAAGANNIHATSILGVKVALDTATLGVTALVTGLIVLVGWVGKLAFEAWEMNGTLDNVAKTTKKLGAEIYNNRKRAADIDTLIYKYEELSNKINKSSEDLTQMAEYTQQIQDLTGEDYLVRSVIDPTQLNMDAVEEAIADFTKKADEDFTDLYNNAIESARKFRYSELDAMTKEYLQLGDAIKLAGKETQSEFKNMTKSAQEYYISLAKAEAKYRNQYTTTFDPDTETSTTVLTYDESTFAAVQNQLTQVVFDSWASADAEGKARLFEEIIAGIPNISDAQKDIITNTLNGAQTILDIQNMFGEGANEVLSAIGGNLDKVDKVINLLKNIELPVNEKNNFIQQILSQSPIAALNNIINRTKELGLSFEEVNELIIIMNELEFEGLDTQAAIVSLKALGKTASEVQSMLSGEAEFDIEKLKNAVSTYPELAKAMADSAQLSNEQINTAMSLEEEAVVQKLTNENILYQNQIDVWQMQIDQYEEMLNNENYLQQLSIDTAIQLQSAGFETMLADFQMYKKAETDYAIKQAEIQQKANTLIKDEGLSATDALKKAYKELGYTATMPDMQFSDQAEGAKDILDTSRKVIQQNIDNLQAQINQYKAFQQINLRAISQIKDKTIYNKAKEEAKEYESKLNEIYALMQKLAVLEQKMEELNFIEENTQSGEEWVEVILTQNLVLEEQIKTTEQLVAAQKDAQDSLYSQMAPALKNVVRIIDGRMVPVMSKYNKLTPEQKEAVDNAAESFNDYAEDIDKSTNSLSALSKEQKDNIQLLEDRVVEAQKTIAEAYKNAEKEKLDILVKGLDEEKRLLDKRKEMYDKAFSEEDYTNNLQALSEKRQDIISKLSALEGATDLNSLKKKEELTKQLDDLNKEYNTNVRDYNRESLLERLDDEIENKDQQIAAAEEAYEKLINDTEYVEEQVTAIMNGGVDNVVNYLKENLPEYTEAFSLEKDNIEEKWNLLAESAIYAMDAIEGNLPDLNPFMQDIQDLIDAYNELTKDALTASSGLSSRGGSSTTTQKLAYFFNGKQHSTKAAAEQAKTAYVKPLKDEYNRLLALVQANPRAAQYLGQDISRAYTSLKNAEALQIDTKYVSAKTGGLVDYTGFAMLHGKPKKPERVLSGVQTELFERMVLSLEERAQALKSPQLVTSEGITIGSINITTPELNTNQDFAAAGITFAKAFKDAIAERGININKKR